MILPNAKEAKHKAWLYRILTRIYDDHTLAASLYFKGGTCAAMRGFWIDTRWILILIMSLRKMKWTALEKMEEIFIKIGLEIKKKVKIRRSIFCAIRRLPTSETL